MATDFTYGKKQILSSGPFRPSGKDMPNDARTRVEVFADIASIPTPFVGMKITVLADETNNYKMTDYIVKSLKANSAGIANMLIDEVVRYVDYLGVSSSGGGTGAGTGAGLTTEQTQQLQTAYEHSQSMHVQVSDIPTKVSELENDSSFVTTSELNTKANVSDIPTKTSQLTNDSNYLTAIPSEYITEGELEAELINKVDKVAGKGLSTNDLTNEMVAKINNAATQAYVTNAIAEARLDGSDVDLSGLATKDELNEKAPLTHSHNMTDISDLQTALDSKVNAVSGKSLISDTEIARLANVDNYDDTEIRGLIPTKVSQLTNDSNYLTSVPSEYVTEDELNNKGYATTAEVDQKIANGTVDLSGYASKEEVTNLANQISSFQDVNETLGDKTGLPSGDSNVIASINRIDEKSEQNKNDIADIINNKLDGKTFKFLTQAEYDILSESEKNNETIEYHITDAPENSHTHTNKEVLDKISEDTDGSLLFNGNKITSDSTSGGITNVEYENLSAELQSLFIEIK